MATRSGSVARGASTITEPTATRPLWFKPLTASSFLRSFSSTCLHAPSLLLAAKPKHDLPTRDTPGRITARSRQRASPLSDRSSRLSPNARSSPPPPPPPPPPRRPSSSTSSFAALAHRLDTRLFSRLPANFVLYTIIALNVLVFGSWLYAAESMRKFSDPRMYLFMSKNFLSGYLNVQQGRWWTMLTSCVSHETLDHFLLNMVSLAFMAPPVLALTGPTTFVLLYFGAGVVSSVVSMVGKALVPPDKESRFSAFSHGASGSVYAIMSAFACVHPRATFLVFFAVPAPAWLCVSGIFAWDLWHAAGTPKGRTDSASHVGGILAGIAFWRFGLRGVRL